ncbi:proprotein convertase subtilisin/kexin type 5 isoform X2 [Bombina bombina]|uniref:proprotein convertase subtilisin/kexin type 5 isoform X2 n=1 Tax=Bombina bombina TaxID=8345 RepID=UPI00235A54BD|nr:proprotein convertase subtilisin/kexin type 5 isoform X2 [Bombina bombina]
MAINLLSGWCLLSVLLGILVPTGWGRMFTNHWAVRISAGAQEAERIASKYGYVNRGQIGALHDYYHFYHSRTIKRSVLSSRGPHSFISMEPKVEWIQQQVVKRRIKRDYKQTNTQSTYFNDPKWPSMWYMHCNDNAHHCQSDMNIVGAWKRGYTGKNVVVTILDDGIERNHPDLMQNYDAQASTDINGNDFDPMPRYDASNENKHGTRCAGEVAATANNSHCTVGIAFNAKIGGVRMLDGDVTDMVEAKSLSLNPQHVHIYSASWGPDDDGKTVDGPASLAREAFENGIRTGRRGYGSVYVWASGNGGRSRDHCSCDGYTNSIYTISISSTTESGKKPWYLEECASTLATTYSSGESYDRKVITTDLRQRCTDSHTGTSASAPMAAGIIALALEANPFLTWRDVQHIIVRTSRQGHLNAPDWKTNAAGHKVSHLYGFGLMDAEAMVIEAEKWTTVPAQHICVENTDRQIRTIRPDNVVRSIYKATGCADNSNHHVIYLEHVVVRITITHPRRGDLAIYLTSPSGTRSQLLANRLFDHSMEGFKNWEFMTTHCWGEKASGDWILEIHDTPSQLRNFKTPGKLKEWSLVLYGTSIQPYSPRNDLPKVERVRSSPVEEPSEDYSMDDYTGPCNVECSNGGCDGPGPYQCNDCLHFSYKAKNNTRVCVSECPSGHYNADKKKCKKCSFHCDTCKGSRSDQCTSCKLGFYLIEETNSCASSCPTGFYLNEHKTLCQRCSENCKTCTSDQTCTECKLGLSLQGSRCAINCEDGKYYSANKKECEPCHRSCATCTGPGIDNCINCTEFSLYEDGKCVVTCSTGYYFAQSKTNGYKTCKRCDASCLACSGPGDRNCTSCPDGYVLEGNVCVVGMVCKDGQYLDKSEGCISCDASCSKCTGPGRSNCIGCSITRIFNDGQCVLKCPTGKYEFHRQCHMCHNTCHECSGSEHNRCTSCGADINGRMRFLYKGECREACPQGHYAAESTCMQCPDNCELCNKDSTCVRCLERYYLNNGICQELQCAEGEVEDPDTGKCMSCAKGCRQCLPDDPTTCTSCINGYYMFESLCYENCPDNTYNKDSEMICIECDFSCFTCTEDECFWCEEGFFLQDGACVSNCGVGFYADDIDRECESCHKSCESCLGPDYDECTACKKNFPLTNGICIDPSKMQQARTFWNGTGSSEPCDKSCKTCNGSATACTSCQSGTFLMEESCIYTCPKGTFSNEKDHRCEKCTSGCEQCTETDECLRCLSGYLHDGICHNKCPDGFVGIGGGCTECDGICKTCEGVPEYCLSCSAPNVLEQATCKSSCSDKYTAVNGVCKHCPPNCQGCADENTCTECIAEYFLLDKECLDDCPDGYYDGNGICHKCDPMCAQCSGPNPNDCEECANTRFFLYNGECFGRCPKGSYYDSNTKECQDCDNECKSCSSSIACDECRDGLVKNSEGHCVSHKDCSIYEYQDQHHSCKPCHKQCSRCTGPTNHHCLSCKEGHYLLNYTCVEKCPDGYYTEEDERRCAPCHSSCKTCTGRRSTHCLSCKEDWYLLGHSCVQNCVTGYYADNSTRKCEKCHIKCETCFGPESSNCLSCYKNFFLMHSKTQCLNSCPESYYENSGQKTCERCHPTCKTCSGSGALYCNSCFWNYQLFGGVCVSECLAGEFKIKEDPDLQCDKCHDSCVECKGAGPQNCTVCPASFALYVEEGRCVHCCSTLLPDLEECCDCTDTWEECILRTIPKAASEGNKKTALFITMSILLILSIGGIIFYWRKFRVKRQSVKKAGYEKLPEQTKSFQSFQSNRESTSSFHKDQVIEYRDRDEEEEEDDDEDIVYMGQDGTVYRKFKYGLLEDDDDEDLEYDDESYSFR